MTDEYEMQSFWIKKNKAVTAKDFQDLINKFPDFIFNNDPPKYYLPKFIIDKLNAKD